MAVDFFSSPRQSSLPEAHAWGGGLRGGAEALNRNVRQSDAIQLLWRVDSLKRLLGNSRSAGCLVEVDLGG